MLSCVSDEFKNKGIARGLYAKLVAKAKSEEIKTLHLLTTTAENYYKNLGFIAADGNSAPETIRNTAEFAHICPSNSIYMLFRL